MIKLSDKVWLDPQKVIAVVGAQDGAYTTVYLENREGVYIDKDINDVMQKINDYRKEKMREFLKIKGVL